MELSTLSSRYGNFYAPAFAVRLGSRDVMRDLVVPISQVEVDLVLGAAARFSFTVVNTYSIKAHAFLTGRGDKVLDLLKFGAEVSISMGYGDAKSVPLLATGLITEITTSFPEAGLPELAIAGYDHAFPLTVGKKTAMPQRKSPASITFSRTSRRPRSGIRRSSRTRRATSNS